MNRQRINRLTWTAPLVMSLCAFLLVIAALATGNARPAGPGVDENAAAHIFQLLIALQSPFLLIFLFTADWGRWQRTAGRVVLMLGAIFVAFAPVALFKL